MIDELEHVGPARIPAAGSPVRCGNVDRLHELAHQGAREEKEADGRDCAGAALDFRRRAGGRRAARRE